LNDGGAIVKGTIIKVKKETDLYPERYVLKMAQDGHIQEYDKEYLIHQASRLAG